MIFIGIVYILCVFYIIASYYKVEDSAYHLLKVMVLLPIAAIMMVVYFFTVLVALRVPKALEFANWLHAKLDKLEKVIKNER